MNQLELELSTHEAERFEDCETIIEHGLETFYEVGKALLEIRDARLYRSTHRTFEEYCRERWQMSRVHAHRMIDAAGITENLLPTGNTPTNEFQLRPLAGLDPTHQRLVWGQAVSESNDQQPTAATVTSVRQSLTQLIDKRRTEREQEAKQPTPKQAQPQPPPPLTPKELKELRAEMRVNSEYNSRLMAFVSAIETFSQPRLPVHEIAEQIREMDTPDKDWCGQAQTASVFLNNLAKELAL